MYYAVLPRITKAMRNFETAQYVIPKWNAGTPNEVIENFRLKWTTLNHVNKQCFCDAGMDADVFDCISAFVSEEFTKLSKITCCLEFIRVRYSVLANRHNNTERHKKVWYAYVLAELAECGKIIAAIENREEMNPWMLYKINVKKDEKEFDNIQDAVYGINNDSATAQNKTERTQS